MDKKNNLKPLSEQVAGQLVEALENGTSIFQKPLKEDGTAAFIPPFNAVSGKTYAGVPALILAMKEMDDPRWLTKKQARFNELRLEQNPKGTVISFPKNSELRPVLDERGDKVRGEDGRAQVENVKLDKTFYVNAVMYNGSQVENLPDLEETLHLRNAVQPLTPMERAQLIIYNSKVVIEEYGDAMRYDPRTDTILMPDKTEFASEVKYYAAVMREMPAWAEAQDRVTRPLESEVRPNGRVRDNMRANIAALMLSAELNLGYEPLKNENQVKAWVQMLKDDPKELFKSAGESQWLTKYVLGFEKEQEIKEEVKQEATDEVKQEVTGEPKEETKKEAAPAVANPNKLDIGDNIAYNNASYNVKNVLKNGKAEVEIKNADEKVTKIKVGPSDNLYTSLLNARDFQREMGQTWEEALEESFEQGEDWVQQDDLSIIR